MVCTETKFRFRGYCSAYSHWKFIDVPEVELSYLVSPTEFLRARRQNKYRASDGKRMSIVPEDKSITVDSTNTYCEGMNLKLHISQIVQQSLVLTQINFTMSSEEFLQDVISGKIVAKNEEFELLEDFSPQQGGCMSDNKAVIFDKQDLVCSYKLIREVRLPQESENVLEDKNLGLLFNLTTSKKLDTPGCPRILLYATTLQGVFVSLDTTAGELNPVQNLDVRESVDLLPTLQYMERRNQEVIKSIQLKQETGSCELWRLIPDDTDHLHPVVSARGLFVRRVGQIIYEYSYSPIRVPLVETPYCINSIPVAQVNCIFPVWILM